MDQDASTVALVQHYRSCAAAPSEEGPRRPPRLASSARAPAAGPFQPVTLLGAGAAAGRFQHVTAAVARPGRTAWDDDRDSVARVAPAHRPVGRCTGPGGAMANPFVKGWNT